MPSHASFPSTDEIHRERGKNRKQNSQREGGSLVGDEMRMNNEKKEEEEGGRMKKKNVNEKKKSGSDLGIGLEILGLDFWIVILVL